MSKLTLWLDWEWQLSYEGYKVGDCIFGYKIKKIKIHKYGSNEDDIFEEVQLKKTENVDSLHMLIFAITTDVYWEDESINNMGLIKEVLKDCDKTYLQIIYVHAMCHYCHPYQDDYINNIMALLKNAGVVEMSQEGKKQILEDCKKVDYYIEGYYWSDYCNVCAIKPSSKINVANCFLSHHPLFWSNSSIVSSYKMLIENNPYYNLIAKKRKSALRRLKRDLKGACYGLNYYIVVYILSIIHNVERVRIKECELKYKTTDFQLNIATIKEFTQYSEIMKYLIKDVGMIVISYVLNQFLTSENKEKCIERTKKRLTKRMRNCYIESLMNDNEKRDNADNIIKSA